MQSVEITICPVCGSMPFWKIEGIALYRSVYGALTFPLCLCPAPSPSGVFVGGGGSVGSNPLFVIDGDSLLSRFRAFENPPQRLCVARIHT